IPGSYLTGAASPNSVLAQSKSASDAVEFDDWLLLVVRVKGLEPPLPYGKQILSLPRLPFRHTRTRAECACSACLRQGAQTRGGHHWGTVDAAARSADRAR